MAKVAEYKKNIVDDILKLARKYPIIGLINMSDMPAQQLQSMRKEMRGKVELFMTKKRLIKIAIDKIATEKKGIKELENHFEGMPALLFSNESPFKLSKFLQKSKASAPAKAGQIAPKDISIPKGPTPFAPGPIISELSSIGLKVGVESGKVAVKEDAVVVKKGEKIKQKVAEVLTRLDIKPMEVGLGIIAAYEDGVIYLRDVLDVDEKAFSQKLNLAAVQAFNLAFNIEYPTKENISLLIAKAFNDAKAIGISQKIFDEGIIEILLSQAEREMLALKGSANIETKSQEIKEKEGSKQEEPKAAEKIGSNVQKENIQKEFEKKEKKILEEEKQIIEEEKKLEEEKPKSSPAEKEIQEAVKEEEEKELENERIGEEKDLEEIEKQKEKMIKRLDYDEGAESIKEKKAQKEVEDLTKELLKRGTLRK